MTQQLYRPVKEHNARSKQKLYPQPTQLSQTVQELDANPEVAAAFLSPLVASAAKTSDEMRSQLHARLAAFPDANESPLSDIRAVLVEIN